MYEYYIRLVVVVEPHNWGTLADFTCGCFV